jgi:predicted chitinase
VIDPDNRHVYGINLPGADGRRRHAERVAIDRYRKQHGDIPPGSIVVTTLSPCNSHMDERAGESCKDLLNSMGIHKVYCGYIDPTQHDDQDADFSSVLTQNDELWEACKAFADTFLHEQEIEEGWRSALAGAAAAGAMAFTPAPANSTAAPTISPAMQPAAAVQQSPAAAAKTILSQTAQAAGIQGTELAQFLAQCAHESGDFAHLEELGGNKYLAKYDPTVNPAKAKALGNTQAGDGAKYKGRSFIQITGKANHANAGQALGIDLVNNPELAAKPDIAAKIAVWYWQNRVKPYVQDFSDTRSVTKRINPGLQGLQDRVENFKDYQQQIAATAPQPAKVAAVAPSGAAG